METAEPFSPKNNEEIRLRELESFNIMDTEPEICFDQHTQLASIVCKSPIALLSFIDSDRQWFKSSIGISLKELPKYLTPCNETMNREGGFYEINDALDSALSCPYQEYLVETGFRSYIGVPVKSRSGNELGVLCVIDYFPRRMEPDQLRTLKLIAKEITDILEIRRSYLQNLDKLMELGDALSYTGDTNLQDKAHKVATRAMAELAMGVIYQVRPLALTIENISAGLLEVPELDRTGKTFQETLSLLKESGSQILQVLKSLDMFISAEKEKWMKLITVNDSLNETLRYLGHKFESLGIKLNKTEEGELRILGNSSQVIEAVFAIINNAIEAVQDADVKEISVSLFERDHHAVVRVEDSGYGVDEHIVPFIFKPFFTTKGTYGTGVGLSIALTHVQNHKGTIVLVNNFNPTVFEIRLPLP